MGLKVLEYIHQHYIEIQFAATFGGIFLLLLLEPNNSGVGHSGSRWLNNIALTFLNFYILIFWGGWLMSSGLLEWLQPQYSFFESFEMPVVFIVLLTVFAFEFLGYWYHRALHSIPLLWRIHAVHHADTQLDVTTSHRSHPFEGMLFSLVSLPLLLSLGVPFLAAFSYSILRLLISQISHANIRLPEKLDMLLRLLLVTPDFHRMHHLSKQQYTDSNYGVITPWFDYMFGTASRLPAATLREHEIGLSYLRSPKESRLDRLLLLPFFWKK